MKRLIALTALLMTAQLSFAQATTQPIVDDFRISPSAAIGRQYLSSNSERRPRLQDPCLMRQSVRINLGGNRRHAPDQG